MKQIKKMATRIKMLREQKGVSQDEFSYLFSAFIGKSNPIATMTISNWETGRKLPPSERLIQLSKFYGVTTDYILGISDIEDGYNQRKIEITPEEFEWHIGMPIVMKKGDVEEWVLISTCSDVVDCSGRIISGNYDFTYYIDQKHFVSKNRTDERILPITEVMKSEKVYAVSKSQNKEVTKRVNGFYRHSKDKTYLENENGRRLYYEDYGESYVCINYPNR